MRKNALAYVLTLLIFGGGIYAAIQAGKKLEMARTLPAVSATQPQSAEPATPAANTGASPDALPQVFRENLHDPLSQLLLQLILILLLARLFGAWFVRIHQPAVIGEMIAGIVLGPSLFGAAFPGAFQFIFPAASLGALRILSEVGIILFMFVVGMELDIKHLRDKAGTAIIISHVSILFPYFLGVLFSLYIYQAYASANVSFLAFALFMGIAMSVTAFPVLARILKDRGLTKTYLGSTAITCAAVGDLSAWTILAFVVAVVKAGGVGTSLAIIVLVVMFIALMLFAVKPLLNHFVSALPEMISAPKRGTLVAVLLIVFSAALFTEVIGIHALFGAFLAGIAMPANPEFRSRLADRLENFSSAFLLPLFFAFTGLRTQIGLLNGWEGWAVCLGLVFMATLGKLVGSMVTARWTGMNWHDAFALGALMNTRGLVELIVLSIGLDLGILSPEVFAMAVIMALTTTLMTGPLLSLGNRLRGNEPAKG
jgi:Kef-type K+ transport system membrane component KefB